MRERTNGQTQQQARDRRLFLAIASLLVVGVTDDETWAQRWRESPRDAAAIGLTLQVRDADGPTLSMEGAIDRTGKYLRPIPIELGKISTGHDSKLQGREAGGVTTVMTFADGGSSLRVSISRLTPAVLLEVEGAHVSFFGAPGRVPKRWALPSADSGIRTGRFDQATPPPGAMQHGWMLVWYGADTHFESTKWPMIDWKVKASGPRYPWWPLEDSVFKADVPILFIFDGAPESVTLDETRGLVFRFAEPATKAVLMPIFGDVIQYAEDTERWIASFPEDVAERCQIWADRLAAFPIAVDEAIHYDSASDRVTHAETYEYVTVRATGRRFAPTPAAVALAASMGAPIQFNPPIHKGALVATRFGPANVTPGNRCEWSIAGLKQYVTKRPLIGPSNPKALPLEKELSGEVNRLLEAGHLAPLFYTFVSADESVRAVQSTRYWNDPSEQLYLLADLLDVLPRDKQERLLAYMRRERQALPPENVARLNSADGTRRERFTVARDKQWVAANDRNSHKSDEFRAQNTSSLYRAYGLSRYYQAIGETPGPDVLRFARSALDDSLQDRQWDTLGWSAKKYSHQYRLLRESLRLQITVQCVNRDFAGALGYLRLRNLARKPAEDDAWAHFARLVVLRFALGKYAHYQGRTGLVELPRNPDTAKQLLEIADFRNPVNFFHQVREFVPEGVSLSNGAVPPELVTFGSHLMMYRELVPETARLLTDWGMGPETIVYLDHYTARNGTWYALFSDAIDGRETPWLFLADMHQLFLAHAWIAKTDPNTLVRFVDVPYAKVGDLFHMHRLAETIKAIRGIEYKVAEPPAKGEVPLGRTH